MLELFVSITLTRAAAQAFDVYRAPKPGPTVLFAHGGAWVSGARAEYARLGRAFARAGVCAVVIDYRLAPETKHPGPVDDLERARADVTKTIGDGCAADKMVLMGHSAGAHMIASWATRFTTRVRGFVGLEGIYDIPELAVRYPKYKAQFLGDAFGPEAGWTKASPARQTFVNHAPWLIVHSRADELVDLGQSDRFAAHLGKEHVRVERETLRKDSHFGVIEALETDGALRTRVLRFIGDVTK